MWDSGGEGSRVRFGRFALALSLAVGTSAAGLALDDVTLPPLLDETGARLPPATDASYAVEFGDVDGDGDTDVLVANGGQSRLLINDAGAFSDETASRLPVLSDTTLGLALGDVDGDDDLDLLLANAGANRLLINDGTGGFVDASAARLPASSEDSLAVGLGDLDGDGDLDVVVANRGGQNRLLVNDGTGVFADETGLRLVSDADLSYDVVLADLDGNGSLDLFFANHGVQSRLFVNDGLGYFADLTTSRLPAASLRTLDAETVDVNDDGALDLVLAAGEDGLRVLENDGSGTFVDATARLPLLDIFPIQARAGDIDFDSDLDLIVAAAGQDLLLFNDGTGHFIEAAPGKLPIDTARSFGLALVDVDSDLDLDVLFARPRDQNRLLVNDLPFPRILLSVSPELIEVGDTVTVSVEAFDEDGLAAATLTISSPAGDDVVDLLSDLADRSASYTFAPTNVGPHAATLSAIDTLGNVGTRSVPFDVLPADVTAPTVSLEIQAPAPLLVGHPVVIRVSVTDDRVVVSKSLTVNGSPVALSTEGVGTYVPAAPGPYSVAASATDAAGNVGSASDSFSVGADTEAPVVGVSASPLTVDLAQPVTATVVTSDNVAVVSRSLVVTGPAITGELPIALDASGIGTYRPFQPGIYTFTARALDPSGNLGAGSASFEALGTPDDTPPVVVLSIVPRSVAIGGTVTLTVVATDDVGVTERSLEINGTPVSLDAAGSFVFTPPVIATYTAVATARDGTGNEASVTDTFRAVDPDADDTPPVVAFDTPSEGAVVETLTEIVGTAEDDTLVRYELSASPVNESAFSTFATGDVSIVGGVLGTFDPTLLENGLYRVRLLAEDINGLVSITERVFEVTGQQKVGNFRISFTDLTFQIAGLPLDVVRTYDSRVKSTRDFGVGWFLETRQGSLQHNRTPGVGWQIVPGGGPFGLPCQQVVELAEHVTTVKLTDTESYRFRLDLTPAGFIGGGCLATARFVFVDGFAPGATLTILGNTSVLWLAGGTDVVEFDTFDPYEVKQARLTTADRRSFDVDIDAGVTRIEDRSGNVITFGAGGIASSTGLAVTFTRDGAGRIRTITDPRGNVYRYDYDANGDLASYIDAGLSETTFTYDSGHNLVEIFDPRGNRAVRSEYDDSGRLVATIDSFGNRTEYEHDVGRSQVIRDRLGRVRVLDYDERGNVTTETHPDGTVTTRTFDAKNNVLTETDSLGNTTTFTYDAAGNRTSRTDANGKTETWTYNTLNQVLVHVDAEGGSETNTYDSNGNLLTETDPNGNVTTRTYDATGNVLSLTDPRGATTLYAYDSASNLVSVTDPLGNVQAFTYDASGNLLTETRTRLVGGTPQALVTTNVYDALGRRVQTGYPDGGVMTQGYDENGNLTSVVDTLGRETRHEYDELNRRVRTLHPDGATEEMIYDAEGQLVGKVDQRGETTAYAYTLRGSLQSVTAPDGSVQTREYDGANRLVATTDENGHRTALELDNAGRVVGVTDPLGNATRYTYDGIGNRVAEENAKGETTRFEYDARRTRVKTIFPDGTEEQIEHTPNYPPAFARIRDRAGRETVYGYDLMMQLTSVTDPLGNEWTFTYDEVGNRTSQTDPNGHVTRFEFDEMGRETRRELPGGLAQRRVYDLAGNLVERTDFGGATTTYAYDSMDRLIERVHPDASSVLWTYDPVGDVAAIADGRGTTTYAYDTRSRLTGIVQPDGLALAYGYDPASRLTSLTAIVGGVPRSQTHTYDAADRIATLTDSLARVYGFAHDATGKRTTVSHPNGVTTTYTYNRLDQMVSLATVGAASTVLQAYDYTIGADGNRSRTVEADGTVHDYLYDGANRLTRETVTGSSGYDATYAYDSTGNLVRVDQVTSSGASSRILQYDERDRLLLDGATAFTWDDDGRLTARLGPDGVVNVWDSESRLVEAMLADGTVERYEYDAMGNRVSRAVTPPGGPTSTTRFLVDTRGKLSHVVAEVDASGLLLAQYVRAGDELFSVIRPTGTRFYHADALGSVRRLTDETGAVTDSYTYDALGNLLAHAGSDPNPYLFAGEPLAAKGQFYYNRARWLDPVTGRFLSMDPLDGDIERTSTLHRYAYAGNNPVNFTDPSGEMTLVSVSVSINIQSNIRSSNAVSALSVLHRVRFVLGQTGRFSFRALQRLRAANPSAYRGLQNHHLIEKRFWQRIPDLQKIWTHVDDMPAAFLSRSEHQLITNAWQQVLGRAGTGTHIPYAQLGLPEIRIAVNTIYANWPALQRALLTALL